MNQRKLGHIVGNVWAHASGFVRRFAHSTNGNIGMVFGLSLIAVLAAAGGGIDFARAQYAKNRMAGALDAAALAVGGQQDQSYGELQDLAQGVFDANYPDDALGSPRPVVLDSAR